MKICFAEKAILVVTLALIQLIATAQNRSDTLTRLIKKAAVPGVSLAYLKDGKLQEHYALGVRSNDAAPAVNDSTIFSAASLSKSVFSYAVFGLVREKKLDLDKPLYTYYIYKDVAGDPRSKLVTARMILSHSPGLPNWRDGDSLRFKLNPGEKYNYSGEGMVWLSHVVEAITGKDIETYISEKIFRPLNMNHTSYVWQKSFGDNYAYPHIDIGRSMSKDFPSEANVAHSLQTTAVDFAKFLAKMLQDKEFMKALQKEPTMTVADHLSWGMGFGHQLNKDGLAFWQWGDNGTFKAFLIGYPGKKEALVYFANSNNGLKIAKDIVGLYFSKDQPALAWLGTDSSDAPAFQVFQQAVHGSVREALLPYYQAGNDRVDSSLLSLSSLQELGNRFVELREFGKAIDFFDEGIRIDSNYENFYAGLTEAYLRSGNRQAAMEALQHAARINPSKSIYNILINKLRGHPAVLKAGEKMISFQLRDYVDAHHVSLAGTFNGWNDFIEPMHWENGAWITSISLPKGKYRYKFVVDGVWITDTRNPVVIPGTLDSELMVEE